MQDRIKLYYHNYSICETGCLYGKIEKEDKINYNQNLIGYESNEFDCIILKNSTLGLIRCYNLVII